MIAKVGLDGHDRGAKLVASALSQAGMEVIYTGLRQTAEQVVEAAIQEDVDFLGLSFLSGDHMTITPKVMRELEKKGAKDIKVIIGGIILQPQISELIAQGVDCVFRPGKPLSEIVEYIEKHTV